jgi:hypothetical protein
MKNALGLVFLTLAAAPGPVSAQPAVRAKAVEAQRLRRELRAMEALLDQTVAQVSRPNPAFVLAGAPASRGYLLSGDGVVFVLAPRRLPMSPMVMTGRVVVIQGSGRPSDLRQLEVQVAEFQAQVQQEWQALEQSFDEVQARLWAAAQENANPNRPGRVAGSRPDLASPERPAGAVPPPAPARPNAPAPPEAPLPPTPAEAPAAMSPPEAPVAPAPAPPWTFWGQESAEDGESRAPERVVADTRDALLLALETYGHVLASLPPDETISVVLDFVGGTPFVDENARPARSLSLRVRKRDLDDRKAGRLSPEELRRRIETTEY